MPTRVLIVDPNEKARTEIAAAVCSRDHLQLVADAESITAALPLLSTFPPHVIVVDEALLGDQPAETLKLLFETLAERPGILALANRICDERSIELCEAGVADYLPRTNSMEEIRLAIKAISRIQKGKSALAAADDDRLLPPFEAVSRPPEVRPITRSIDSIGPATQGEGKTQAPRQPSECRIDASLTLPHGLVDHFVPIDCTHSIKLP